MDYLTPNRSQFHGSRFVKWLLFLTVAAEAIALYNVNFIVLRESIPDALLFFTIAFTGLTVLRYARVTHTEKKVLILTFGLLCALLLAGIGALTPDVHWRLAKKYTGSVLTFFIVVYWSHDMDTTISIQRGLIVVGVVGVISAALQAAGFDLSIPEIKNNMTASRFQEMGVGLGFEIPRVSGILGSYGNYGSYVATSGFCLMSGFLPSTRDIGVRRKFAWLGPPVLLAGTILSQSRSGILAVAVGLLVFGALALYRRRPDLAKYVFIFIVPTTLAVVVVLPFFWHWLVGIQENSAYQRVDVYLHSLPILAHDPINGVGFGGAWELALYRQGAIIHNSFLRLTVALGGVGAVFYFAFFGLATLSGLRAIRYRDARGALAVGLLAAMVAVTVELNLYAGAADPCIFTIGGLLVALNHNIIPARPRHPAHSEPKRPPPGPPHPWRNRGVR